MILIASMRVQIPPILDNSKRVIECRFVWKLVPKLDFSFETNLVQKCIQSYQTTTAINASRFLLIKSNLHAFPYN